MSTHDPERSRARWWSRVYGGAAVISLFAMLASIVLARGAGRTEASVAPFLIGVIGAIASGGLTLLFGALASSYWASSGRR